MKPDSDAFNFYLIYATRHPKGVEVFKSVERRTEEQTHLVRADVQLRQRQEKTGNFELFAAPVLYRESKYQQLAEDNRARAKKRVWELLLAFGEVSYDNCWAEALQFPAVLSRRSARVADPMGKCRKDSYKGPQKAERNYSREDAILG